MKGKKKYSVCRARMLTKVDSCSLYNADHKSALQSELQKFICMIRDAGALSTRVLNFLPASTADAHVRADQPEACSDRTVSNAVTHGLGRAEKGHRK